MKLVFMGTPDFARRPLEYLHQNTRHELLAVVTGPDKRSGRGKKLTPTAVKTAAERLGLPVLTPDSLRNAGFIDKIETFNADIFVVVAFRILPEKLFTIPRNGSINLHGSLLPKYRGAAPINWALINGEEQTGVTTFFLKKRVDTGNIIYREKTEIGPEETFDELYARMSEMSGPALEKTLDMIESGEYELLNQDDKLATPAPKITPFDCLIDWGFPSENVINFIRGMSSVPGAYTSYKGAKLKILRAKNSEVLTDKGTRPGTVIPDKKRLIVATADGTIEVTETHPQGKKRMTGQQFVNGYHPANMILGAREEEN